VKLTDAQRSHLEELLRDRAQWFKEKILADIAAEERRDDEDDNPRAGLSAYTLACLESELGIM
jgi:DNA-binding MarR family transcriptional regulator